MESFCKNKIHVVPVYPFKQIGKQIFLINASFATSKHSPIIIPPTQSIIILFHFYNKSSEKFTYTLTSL